MYQRKHVCQVDTLLFNDAYEIGSEYAALWSDYGCGLAVARGTFYRGVSLSAHVRMTLFGGVLVPSSDRESPEMAFGYEEKLF